MCYFWPKYTRFMKRLLFFWILLFFVPAASFAQEKGLLKKFFTSKQSNYDLMAFKNNMLEIYNIQLDYTVLKFDNKSRLQEIAFTVDFRNGMKCSCGPNVVSKKKQYGFFRDYRKRAKQRFGCIQR